MEFSTAKPNNTAHICAIMKNKFAILIPQLY